MPAPQVLLQLGSGFAPPGLRTADRRELYADPARLAAVSTPIFFMCGDRDRMCPPRVSEGHTRTRAAGQKARTLLLTLYEYVAFYGQTLILLVNQTGNNECPTR